MKKQMTMYNKIESEQDLQQQIALVKNRIKQREIDFEERWERLPTETIKATLGKIIPFFINNRVAGSSWHLLKGVFSFFTKDEHAKEAGWKQTIGGPAKQFGLFALAKLVMGLVKR